MSPLCDPIVGKVFHIHTTLYSLSLTVYVDSTNVHSVTVQVEKHLRVKNEKVIVGL